MAQEKEQTESLENEVQIDPAKLAAEQGLFMDCTYLINNREIREFVQSFLSERVPKYFWTIPAARHKEHHMAGSHGEGGLVRHTLCILVILYDIVNLEYLQFKSNDKDLIFAAAMLHDTFKHGKDGTKYERSHPNIAAQEILKFAKEQNKETLGKIIAGLVVSHMGTWGNQKPGNRGQFIVHLGDYLGSRPYLQVSFDPLKEAIKEREKELYNT